MGRHWWIILLPLVLAAIARADMLILEGSSIPLRGCQIQDVKHGRVYFRDVRGRRQFRELSEITAIGFDDLPQLEQAERYLQDDQADAGRRALIRAAVDADEDLQRVWTRARLATLHAERGEYTLAAAHAAAVFRLRPDDATWRRLEPACPPDSPSAAAWEEAMAVLARARRDVEERSLRIIIDRMRATIEPLRPPGANDPRGEPGTLSAFRIDDIRRDSFLTLERNTAPEPPRAPPPTPSPRIEVASDSTSPSAIDDLIRQGRTTAALAACERVAADPGDRHLGRFLEQYGRCLWAEGRSTEAAVMFTRCALMHERSDYAAPSLVAAALIYRDEFNQPAIARRLVERALAQAARQDQPDVQQRARAVLATLPDAE